ncbi:DNA damage-responsive transcriptional repressor RPH1 [Exophiala dermatitidis]|uniref:[histone H3]-trimethyl-L-lysine(9) demethylase n=1 Tax=Exophiala dermatitidis (strain ATCC 34100 / CBS 525.76 / NIH/UT8656) TaxID=858893 RepID=H6BQ22_EXODN|nr:jumonji domain-containing protein 2 [Exophiala dermatitidis NIH/UT8656]EHY54468.1 jumonji domain-containing protein 2 [Exophiala dermatitidis NIH/UT8656]
MATTAMPTLPGHDGLGVGALDKDDIVPDTLPPQVHTPPITDEASHKDDDAASSSSLSDLGDDLDEEENRMRFEEAARAGAEAEQYSEVKPDRYENGVPIFTPTMEQFKDFQRYVKGVDPFGMQSGIVLIDPPEEWYVASLQKRARKPLDELVKTIKIKNPLTQEFHGAQGIYTQRNMEKMRSYNLPQWKALCEQTENQPPARRGEKRLNADKLLGRGSTRARKSEVSATPEPCKGRAKSRPIKQEPIEHGSTLLAPPTPTSPEVKPSALENEETEDAPTQPADPTPTKGKGARKPGRPRGRPAKSTTKKEAGNKGAETTVAARRLRNAREANDEVDEELFRDFDYRVYDHDQWTAERCDELEDKYWKSLNFSNPMYGADMPGSLFDDDTKEWNVAKLPNLLDLLGAPIPGVNTAYLYLGMWRATFAWHLEDVDLYSINYIHFGAPKQWYSISQKDAPKFEAAMRSLWPTDAKNCDQFLRHKTYLVSPSILKSKFGVQVNKVVHREGQFVITFPIGYHSGYNLGYNCAESVNFAIDNWLQYGKTARKCRCESDSVFIDVDWFMRKMNGEPSPEYEEVEVTDDEDEIDEPTDLPTPPSSDRGKSKMPQKRKRAAKELGPNKKAKKLVKIRKVSKNQPCCLCPNDFPWEELLPTTHGQRAHRTCALYTPETYIANKDGKEMVYNVENISKARLELKCYECRQKKGSCFQCSSAKCTKSYHATCAMQAGVQVDRGEIAVWHDGVEYRDIGFDWRCRLHRSIKRTRITSELSACNHANSCWQNADFRQYLYNINGGDLIQFQATNSDDIEAGLVIAPYDEGQYSVLVKIIPDLKVVKEVEPTSILFVDSATSCLQKPSANALDLPEDLQGMTASLPESTEKKPSAGDPFTEEPRTEWAEFASAEPPFNKDQKAVDLSKDKQVWLYLGESSTEAKAQYMADPAKRTHDPASNFLDVVAPAKAIMAPPPQPKRLSLTTSQPVTDVAAKKASLGNNRQNLPAPRNATPKTPGTFSGTTHDLTMNSNPSKMLDVKPAQIKPSQYRDLVAGQEARLNEQARILQRQQAKSQQLDAADRSNTGPQKAIGIGQDAAQQQRQFQRGTQHAKHMKEWSTDPSLPSLGKAYPDYQFTEFHPNLPAGHYDAPSMMNTNTPQQQYEYGNEWMNSGDVNRRLSGGPRQNLEYHSGMSSQYGRSASPATTPFPAFVQQPQLQYLFQGHQPQNNGANNAYLQASPMESIRAAASHPPPPPPSAEVERQRRISNPAYPFKSPDQIKAQKEAEKKSPPGSRPGSSYMLPSPRMQHESYLQSNPAASSVQALDPQNPPQFINPNATQISPPGTSAGRRSDPTGGGFSGLGVQSTIDMKNSPTVAMDVDLAPFPANYVLSGNDMRNRSTYDPLSNVKAFPQHKTRAPEPPMAPASRQLLESLEKRPLGPNGLLINDRPIPHQLTEWQERGGFWGRVAGYYIQKHQSSATVYKSPFAVMAARGNEGTLAQRYYNSLEPEQQAKIDESRRAKSC